MAFCGQCGFLLPPEATTTCPRCSSSVTSSWESADPNADAPTIISALDKTQLTEISYHSKPELADDTTTQGPPYLSYAFPPGPSYPPQASPHKSKIWTILSVFLLIFLVGITIVTLVVGPSRLLQMVIGGTVAPQITPIPPTSQASTPVPVRSIPTAQPSASPEQQARLVIDHYYTAINNKDYQTAYDLWLNYPATYQHFANGFADTSYDTYTFGNIAQQSDGTVQVDVTIIATSTSYQQTTYEGYYIVGQQSDGTWKIISAKIHQA